MHSAVIVSPAPFEPGRRRRTHTVSTLVHPEGFERAVRQDKIDDELTTVVQTEL
jgi:hypothetical protein